MEEIDELISTTEDKIMENNKSKNRGKEKYWSTNVDLWNSVSLYGKQSNVSIIVDPDKKERQKGAEALNKS